MIPAALRGVLFRVGPGKFERGGVKYAHPLDGDGRVDRIEFKDSHITITSRFVETPQYLSEERAGKVLFRGAFGTAPHLSLRTLKNPSNTALVYHGGELLSMWEGGTPFALDPKTLECLGPHSLGGVARVAPAFSVHPLMDAALGIGGDAVCAHAHVDPSTGHLVVLMSKYSLGRTTLRFVEFAADGFRKVRECTHCVEGFTFVHDWVMTPTNFMFFAPPLSFDSQSFRRGSSALECITHAPGCTRIIQLPRAGGATKTFDVPPWFASHFINVFESPAEFVIDCFGTPTLGSATEPTSFHPRRLVLDREGGVCVLAVPLDKGTSEFPAVDHRVHGLSYAHAYYAGSCAAPMDSIIRLDARTKVLRYSTVKFGFHLEPVLAGQFILAFLVCGKKLFLRIIDTESMEEVSRVALKGTNLLGLHSVWVPGG